MLYNNEGGMPAKRAPWASMLEFHAFETSLEQFPVSHLSGGQNVAFYDFILMKLSKPICDVLHSQLTSVSAFFDPFSMSIISVLENVLK